MIANYNITRDHIQVVRGKRAVDLTKYAHPQETDWARLKKEVTVAGYMQLKSLLFCIVRELITTHGAEIQPPQTHVPNTNYRVAQAAADWYISAVIESGWRCYDPATHYRVIRSAVCLCAAMPWGDCLKVPGMDGVHYLSP